MRTALLVDRHADTRAMYAELLRLSAWDVEEAQDGGEALAKALSRRPDVVVTETSLPVIDGFNLCRLLRSDVLTRNATIVIVTGDGNGLDVERARKSGADSVLNKPCLPQTLAEEIARLFAKSEELRTRVRNLAQRSADQVARADEIIEQVQAHGMHRHLALSRAHRRHETTDPPTAPPVLVCPKCDQPLKYVKSHVGGVSMRHQEQWDDFECVKCSGMFQYRQRTRKLRPVPS